MNEAIAVAAAYLLGSIPFAYLAGRMKGVDIRTVGSKNVGATNVFRTLGRGIGITVMALDIAKGLAAVLLAKGITDPHWDLAAAAAAILGHVFPVWLRFRGGKGVATAGGTILALTPLPALIVLVIWFVVIAATRYVSLGSILAAIAFPPLLIAFREPWAVLLFGTVAAAVVVWKHRANIQRLRAGNELRLELGRRPGPGAPPPT
ncbi:MAG: glycerol-3-phosphate 1-O-acyltransferase PlsY [Thermoleophilia bacterium]|nr:glycerol-3-phosphate 1-O-acyltransferase PlsY [Thermoleophilia bacterium]